MAIAPPRNLGGEGSPGTNPEQLFAAGYAACFGSALANVAGKAGVELGEVAITARVSIGPAGRGFGLAVALAASLPDLPREQAESLLARAHEVCPYSNAIRGNVVVDLRLAWRRGAGTKPVAPVRASSGSAPLSDRLPQRPVAAVA